MITTEKKTKNWYTIKVQNNREKSISERLRYEMMREFNEEVTFLIPTQGILSIKDGKKVQKEQILYPGYIFVETSNVDKIAHLVKSTNGATNVLRDNKGTPIILKQSEVDRMIGEKANNEQVILTTAFLVGEKVEITTGPFAKFKGTITALELDKNKVKVEVLIFGRATNVDLTLSDIVKYDG
jgi:transcriptional antiterminator NusG